MGELRLGEAALRPQGDEVLSEPQLRQRFVDAVFELAFGRQRVQPSGEVADALHVPLLTGFSGLHTRRHPLGTGGADRVSGLGFPAAS